MNEETLPPEILAGLRRMGLTAAASVRGERLTGGVSSDIWRAELAGGPVCVKRALGKLKVAADWRAPVERNRYEARWMRRAEAASPGCVPGLLGQDEASCLIYGMPKMARQFGGVEAEYPLADLPEQVLAACGSA